MSATCSYLFSTDAKITFLPHIELIIHKLAPKYSAYFASRHDGLK